MHMHLPTFVCCCNNFVQVKSELPSTFKAYRHQQHRWTCGAANLFRKMAGDIVRSKASILEAM